MQLIFKTLMSMGMKLLTEAFIEDIILWGMKKLSESSKTKVDDELYKKVEKTLRG